MDDFNAINVEKNSTRRSKRTKKTHEEEEQKLLIAKRKAELEEVVAERTAD